MTSLFKPSDIQQSSPTKGKVAVLSGSRNTQQAVMDSTAQLELVIAKLEPNQVIKYWTKGAWSMHDLIEYTLLQTGPAAVTFCSWTIGEEAARKLFHLKESGLITELHALFDYRVKERSPEAHQLLQGTCDTIKLGKSHAKVTVIKNANWGVSIVGSANYSRNARLESGSISTVSEDALFDWDFLQNEIHEHEAV